MAKQLDDYDAKWAPKDLAEHLLLQLKQGRLRTINLDVVRANVDGFCMGKFPTPQQREDMENAVLRKVVELSA